ncbi:MAG: hemolysin family protein [Acidobacteriota bacterium]
MELEIAVAAISLIALLFLATVDMAFSRLSDVGLRRLTADSEESSNSRTAGYLHEILENRQQFRFALSSSIQVLMIVFTVLITLVILRFTGNDHTLLIVSALAIAISATVIMRQILPRMIVRTNTDSKLLFMLPLAWPLFRIASAIITPFEKNSREREQQRQDSSAAPDSTDESDDGAEDFHALMEVGEAEGIIEGDERELIESMVEFTGTRTGEIMTPRTEICGIPVETTMRAARDRMIEEKYSRLPAYRGNIDNIEGVIYVRDLLQAWAEGREDEPISSILRDAYFVPETKPAAELLSAMQADHIQIAIVIDEYGGIAGIVTVEDILEEIVGEIEDEDIEDEEIIEIVEGDDGYWDVLGSTELDKIERLFDLDLEDDEVTTIAGLITSEVGYVPKEGETFHLRGLEAHIVRADDKKVNLVRLRPDTSERELDAAASE